MPALTPPQIAKFRAGGNRTAAYLWLLPPTITFKARVNIISITYPFDNIPFDTVTVGTWTNLAYGQTLWLGSTDGAKDLGTYMVGNANSATIYLNRFSQGIEAGTLNLVDNAYITVFNDYRVWSQPPFINNAGQQFKRTMDVFSAAAANRPVANNSFSHGVFFGTGATVSLNFDATTSFSPSGLSLSYSWNFGDGTPATSTSSAPTGVLFPNSAFRWVRLTVTDSGGQSETKRILVATENLNSLSANVYRAFTARLSSKSDGQVLDVELLANVPKSTYPDGTMGMLFEDEVYADGTGELVTGAVPRQKFVGWHVNTDSEVTGDLENGLVTKTRLTFHDVANRLKTLQAFQQVMVYNAAPSEWSQTALTTRMLDHYVMYILREHSTALVVSNFVRSAETTYNFTQLNSEGTTLWEQANNVTFAQGGKYQLTCNRFGALTIRAYPIYQEVGSRTSTNVISLEDNDIRLLSYDELVAPAISWVKSNAIQVGISNPIPLFSTAAGERPSQGQNPTVLQGMLVASQTELNQVTGQVYAARVRPIEANLELAPNGDLSIDPALFEWVTISETTPLNYRGDTFSAIRFIVNEVVTTYDSRIGQAVRTYRILRETSGTAGQTVIMTAGENPQTFTPPYEVYPNPIPTTGGLGGGGANNLTAIASNAILYRTSNFTATSPTWANFNLTSFGLPAGSSVLHAVQNPYNGNQGWLTTRTGIYQITNLTSGTPSCTLQHTFAGGTTLNALTVNATGAALDASFAGNTHIACMINYAGSSGGTPQTGIGVAFSTNGTTWAENKITTTNQTSSICPASIVVAPNASGVVYINYVGRLHRSNNFGASFTPVSPAVTWASPEANGMCVVSAPVSGNNGNVCVYDFMFQLLTPAQNNRLLARYQTVSNTYADLSSITTVDSRPFFTNRNSFSWLATNSNIAYCVAIVGALGWQTTSQYRLYATSDNFASVQTRASGTAAYQNVFVGNNANEVYLSGVNGNIGYSTNGGVTIASKAVGGSARIVNIFGG